MCRARRQISLHQCVFAIQGPRNKSCPVDISQNEHNPVHQQLCIHHDTVEGSECRFREEDCILDNFKMCDTADIQSRYQTVNKLEYPFPLLMVIKKIREVGGLNKKGTMWFYFLPQ